MPPNIKAGQIFHVQAELSAAEEREMKLLYPLGAQEAAKEAAFSTQKVA